MVTDAFNREQEIRLGGRRGRVNRRLASNEFAGKVPDLSIARSHQTKERNVTNTAGS